MSNFSFSHSVSYLFGDLSAIFIKIQKCHLQILKFAVWERVNFYTIPVFNPLPNNKYLDWSKLKAFADNISNLAPMMEFF